MSFLRTDPELLSMVFGYRLALFFYRLGIFLISFFHAKANRWRKGQQGLFTKMAHELKEPGPRVWFHCASVGEFEQARPIMEGFKQQYPGYQIILTFFSPSGYELRKDYPGAHKVFYLPLDSPASARKLIHLIQPALVLFVKYEFWFFILKELKSAGIPVFLISGIFRPSQRFFHWHGMMGRRTLGFFQHFFVQDDQSIRLLASIGLKNASVAGDTRVDRVVNIADRPLDLPIVSSFAASAPVLFGGSTWPPDEDFLFQYFEQAPSNLKLVIAPHEVDPAQIQRLNRFERWPLVYYSGTNPELASQARILILDTIGILSSAYRFAYIAHVGGAFRTGLHNTLEPAVYGIPVVFGPHFRKFNEASLLIEAGAAFSFARYGEYQTVLNRFFANDRERVETGQKGWMQVRKMAGATTQIMKYIESIHFQ